MKVMLLGNLDNDDDDERSSGGAQSGPRLTRNDSGRDRSVCWSSCSAASSSNSSFSFSIPSSSFPAIRLLSLLSFITKSCDRKCLMFCLAAWTNCSSSSTPRMWAGSNLRAMARATCPVLLPISSTFLSLNQSASKQRSRWSSSAPSRPSHLSP